MYWAYTTMTTVGYGDISAITVAEKIWAILVMVLSGFFFSFSIGRMATVVSRLDADRTATNERLETVSMFLADTSLPRDLSKRCAARRCRLPAMCFSVGSCLAGFVLRTAWQ